MGVAAFLAILMLQDVGFSWDNFGGYTFILFIGQWFAYILIAACLAYEENELIDDGAPKE